MSDEPFRSSTVAMTTCACAAAGGGAVGGSSIYVSSGPRLHIAPVAGSTMNHPMSPPKRRLPKRYHPTIREESTTNSFLENPGFSMTTLYLAPLKYPAPLSNFTMSGVLPEATVAPVRASITLTSASDGLDLNETLPLLPLMIVAHPK